MRAGGRSSSNVTLEPNLTYFVTDHVGIGAGLFFNYADYDGGSDTGWGIGPTVLFDIPIGTSVSLEPGASIAYVNVSQTRGTRTADRTRVVAGLGVNLLFHIRSHFSAGFGPALYADLKSDVEGVNVAKALSLGFGTTLNFWF